MPIPKPKDGEKQPDFMSRCMSALADDDMPQDQKLAVCFGAFRKKGESMDSETKYDEDGHIVVAENVRVTFNGSLDFLEKGSEEEDEEDDE